MYRFILLSAVLLLSLFFLRDRISAQILLPQVSAFCERKDGTIFSINDGFSIRTKCYSGSREVELAASGGTAGATGPQGATGPMGLMGPTGPKAERGAGSIAFVYESFGDYVSVVGKDGKMYYRFRSDADWRPLSDRGIWGMPDSVPVATDKIVDFTQFHLIDEDGNVWYFVANSPEDRKWINLGQP